MWNERHFVIKDETQEFGFLANFDGITIHGQFQFRMHSFQLTEVHTNSFGFGKFETICN
jgi:hypothetical protein